MGCIDVVNYGSSGNVHQAVLNVLCEAGIKENSRKGAACHVFVIYHCVFLTFIIDNRLLYFYILW